MNRRSLLVVMSAAMLAATTGLAVADSFGPAPYDPASGLFATYKTPPLRNSDTFTVPISYHSTFPFNNWAGVHINPKFDPTEVGFVGFNPAPGFMMTPGVGPIPGFTIWVTNATQSGTFPGATSSPVPLGSLVFHATGTTPANNSDTDITFASSGAFSVFNIFHSAPGTLTISQLGTIPASIMVYVPPGAGTTAYGDPIPPGQGQWLHVEQDHPGVHLTESPFFGTTAFFNGQGGVGVEHIPEPATLAVCLAGLAAIVFARVHRWKK